MATFVRGAVGAAHAAGLITAAGAAAQQKITVAPVRRQLGRRVPRLRRRAPRRPACRYRRGRHLDHDAGQLQQQKAAPTIDVAWLDGGISELAEQAGVLTRCPAAIPNLKNVIDQGVYRRGRLCGQLRLLLAGHRLQHARGQAAAGQLEGPVAAEYAGAVALPSPANSSGVPFVFFLARVWSVDPSNLAPLYAKLATLDTALYFDSSGAATNAYQSGEAVIGAHFNVGAWDLIDKGLPIGFAVPRKAPGPPTPGCTWSRARRGASRAPHRHRAHAAGRGLPGAAATWGGRQGHQVPPDVARKLPWGAGLGAEPEPVRLEPDQQPPRQSHEAWNRQVRPQALNAGTAMSALLSIEGVSTRFGAYQRCRAINGAGVRRAAGPRLRQDHAAALDRRFPHAGCRPHPDRRPRRQPPAAPSSPAERCSRTMLCSA